MITPTGVTYSAYWDAIKAGNATHVRITFINQGIVLGDEDISITGGLTLTDMFNSDTDLIFGKAVSKELKVYIINSNKLNGLIWTGEFTLEMGVEIGGVTKWVTIGYFTGEKPNNITSAEVIDFTAYDRMIRFDVLADDFLKTLTYPKTVKNIYDALCAYVGLQNVAGDELANIMSRSFASAPSEMEGYTCRDILRWIAEACGCYATITEAGKVQLLWFTDNTTHAVTGNEEFDVNSADVNTGMTWDEAETYTWDEIETFTWNDLSGFQEEYAVERIVIKQLNNDLDIIYPGTIPYGNTYMIVENPFLLIGSNTDLMNYVKPLFDRLSVFGGYLPVNLNCIGNWCVEAGDVITIDVNSYTITFPVFVKTMRWNGSIVDEYETTGNSVRDSYVTEAQKQKILNNREIRLFVDNNYYGIKSGVDINENGVEITGNKYIKIESGSSLTVESGGQLDVHASGNLSLTGATVEIKSGSTFDVESQNFKISSEDKKMVCGNWTFNTYGCELTGTIPFSISHTPAYGYNGKGGIFWETYYAPSIAGDFYGSAIRFVPTFKFNNQYVYPQIIYDTSINENHGSQLQFDILGVDSILMFGAKPAFNIKTERIQVESIIPPIDSDLRITIYKSSGNSTRGRILVVDYDYPSDRLILKDNANASHLDIYCDTLYYSSLVQNSSMEVKHDIKPLEDFGEKIDALQPVSFVYDDDENEKQRMGLIYEDTVDVMPEICTNDESSKAINYVELIPVLLKEIQELRARVKELEEREEMTNG